MARPPTSCSRMWTSTITILRGGRVRCARRPFQLWDRHPQAFESQREPVQIADLSQEVRSPVDDIISQRRKIMSEG